MTIADDDKSDFGLVSLPEKRSCLKEQTMIFDFSQSSDDAYQDLVRGEVQLASKRFAPLLPVMIKRDLDAQRDDRKLIGSSHAKFFADLLTLLFGDDDDAICNQTSQHPFHGQKQPRPCRAIIAVK